ncbi:hypothetical protein [Aureliella helgolandensis]|uniref:Uncharacterized protein n=1 Tax=Aureliella helgolandensis TaxID=2527968 RepID=A0A518G7T1_9BACT|nr:hypothetical protein [Aureliella helgolandensis]QDV24643.1 hypothetical protein Q31a_29630 [Aureliella helgolandensis]
MKKRVLLIVKLSAVAILGTAITAAVSKERSAESDTPCCQQASEALSVKTSETPKSECCLTAVATNSELAKAAPCSCESSNATKQVVGAEQPSSAYTDAVEVREVADSKADAALPRICACPSLQGNAISVTAVAASQIAVNSASADGTKNCQACKSQEVPGQKEQALPVRLTCEKAAGDSKGSESANKCCEGDCKVLDTVKTDSTLNSSGQKCGMCLGKGEQSACSACEEAGKEAATEESEVPSAVGMPRGMGRGHAGDSQHAKDHQDFFYLIEHRDAIRRSVKNIPQGVETLTESDDDEVASRIQVHVEAMYDRLENAHPIRMRDPLFRAVFAFSKKIQMEVEHTDHGVRVRETSDDAYVVKLIQAHAMIVSLWIKNGYSELPKNHAAPAR